MKAYRHRLFTAFLLIMSLVCSSCQKKDAELSGTPVQEEFILHAYSESDYYYDNQESLDTKTVLQTDGKVLWSPGDSVSFFIGKGNNGGYPLVSDNTAAASQADFVGKIANCSDNPVFYAVYPYNSSASCDGTALTTVLPAEQTAVEGSFADDLFISVATSGNNTLKFYHVCGGFKFSVTGEGINKVVFKNADGASLAGRLTVKFDESGIPVVTSISDGTDAITVKAPDGGTFVPGKYYYAVLPPTKFTQGMTITYYRESDNCVFRTSKEFAVKRAVFGRVYDKDDGLKYRKIINTYGRFNGNKMLPDGVDKETITEMHFHTNSDKVTDIVVSSPNQGEKDRPIYFELDGTVANFYTEADCYKVEQSMMFINFKSLESLDLSNWDTSEAVTMESMFHSCNSLEFIDLSSFVTSNVTDFDCMFWDCNSLKSLDVSGFDTSKAKGMRQMFLDAGVWSLWM